MDLLEEEGPSPVNSSKAKAYMFFQVLELVEEIEIVLV